MKILIVARCKNGHYAPFITEQVAALEREGVDCRFFPVIQKGLIGYMQRLPALRREIRVFAPDVVHAHFVFSGLLACLQRNVPVVTTYHGSDINDRRLLHLSKLVSLLSAWNIFVSPQNLKTSRCTKRFSVIPCGVDINDLQLTDRKMARKKLSLDEKKKYVLFAGSFDREVKNPALARETVQRIGSDDLVLLEFKGYSREEATLLMCAVDALLLTSHNEGSPQVIKEALACGCPIVSVDVGDVRDRVDGVVGCCVARQPDAGELSELLTQALSFADKTNGRERILLEGLDNHAVAKRIVNVYKMIIN